MTYALTESLLPGQTFDPAKYWRMKWVAMTLTLLFSMLLTCGLELSVVLGRNDDPKTIRDRAAAVIGANLWTFLIVSLIGAAVALPRRLSSPTGLIS